jgi:hypothetical protein
MELRKPLSYLQQLLGALTKGDPTNFAVEAPPSRRAPQNQTRKNLNCGHKLQHIRRRRDSAAFKRKKSAGESAKIILGPAGSSK